MIKKESKPEQKCLQCWWHMIMALVLLFWGNITGSNGNYIFDDGGDYLPSIVLELKRKEKVISKNGFIIIYGHVISIHPKIFSDLKFHTIIYI